MSYPPEVQKYLDILNTYEEDDTLETYDILHLYPQELAFPNGYYDSRFFRMIGFNTQSMKKRDLGRHDAIDFAVGSTAKVSRISIYADGSTLIKLQKPIRTDGGQAAFVWE